MSYSQRQFELLSEMGIPVWVQRSPAQATCDETDASVVEEQSVATQALPTARWLVCVENTRLTAAETDLLSAICKACHISSDEWAFVSEPQLAELPDIRQQSRRVLCLAPVLWPSIQAAFATVEEAVIEADALHVIASPSLSEMLTDTRLKATLWSRIKNYVD